MMTPNEIRKQTLGYTGAHSGIIHELLAMVEARDKRIAAMEDAIDHISDAEGDMQSVHVPHPLFQRLLESAKP